MRVPDGGDVGRVQESVNELLDITDAFVREARGVMEFVGRGQYFRKVLVRGLPGTFRHSAEAINHTTTAMNRKVGEFKTSIDNFESSVAGVVQGYAGPNNPFGGTDAMIAADGRFVVNPQMEWAGGGFASTGADLARWAKALYEGRLHDSATVARMTDGVPARLGPDTRYGLGVIIRPTPLGTSWRAYRSPPTTTVCPALCPPWYRTTYVCSLASRSMILALPSSPHWAPTTTVTGTGRDRTRPPISGRGFRSG